MKKTIQILCILLLSTMTMTSCSMFKSEDKKISEALVGTFEEEVEKENVKVTFKWEFEKSGDFKMTSNDEVKIDVHEPEAPPENNEYDYDGEATPPPPTAEPTKYEIKTVKTTYTGTWEVKDKKLTLKCDKVKNEDGETKEESAKEFTKSAKNMEVISYDEKKIVFKDKDGDKHTLTKSKD